MQATDQREGGTLITAAVRKEKCLVQEGEQLI